MNNKLKNQRQGFTLIEVIIVIVIGVVLMLGVFVIVPQVQRGARNTKQQDTARRVLTAVNQFQANNNGNNPKTQTDITDITGELKNGSNQTIAVVVPGPGNPDLKTVIINYNSKCNQTGGDVTVNQTIQSVAVQIGLETGSGTSKFCVNN